MSSTTYIVILIAILVVMNLVKRTFWLISVLALPGTICHEFTHWFMGKLTNGEPVKFSIIPEKAPGGGYVLGYVAFANLRWYNRLFIGLSPLLMLPAAYYLFQWRTHTPATLGWPEFGMAFLIANLISGAFPSRQDLQITAKTPVTWLLLAGCMVWGGMQLKAKVSTKASSYKQQLTQNR